MQSASLPMALTLAFLVLTSACTHRPADSNDSNLAAFKVIVPKNAPAIVNKSVTHFMFSVIPQKACKDATEKKDVVGVIGAEIGMSVNNQCNYWIKLALGRLADVNKDRLDPIYYANYSIPNELELAASEANGTALANIQGKKDVTLDVSLTMTKSGIRDRIADPSKPIVAIGDVSAKVEAIFDDSQMPLGNTNTIAMTSFTLTKDSESTASLYAFTIKSTIENTSRSIQNCKPLDAVIGFTDNSSQATTANGVLSQSTPKEFSTLATGKKEDFTSKLQVAHGLNRPDFAPTSLLVKTTCTGDDGVARFFECSPVSLQKMPTAISCVLKSTQRAN